MTSAQLNRAQAGTPPSLALFRGWLARAKPGEQIEYHRGHLVWDRVSSGSTNHIRRALDRMADAALKAAERGLVDLVQRRHGDRDYAYIAVRASGRRSSKNGSGRKAPSKSVNPAFCGS